MSAPSLVSTYGAWLISLFVETILYGIGIFQTFLYFQWWPTDSWGIKATVALMMFFETTQIIFFFRSTFFRFVIKFGEIQGDLIWSDSLQLLANYLTAFTVQLHVFLLALESSKLIFPTSYFASRIYKLTREGPKVYNISKAGIYAVVLLAVVQISAGIAQTVRSYQLRSFARLDETKAITTLQTAASLACDICITLYLCYYLGRHKNAMRRTQKVLRALMMNAVNRGMLTSLTSAGTMILFLAFPDTFWFFLSLAPNSKLYMNSMMATLNMRQHVRNRLFPKDMEWDTIQLNDISASASGTAPRPSISVVEFVKPSSPTMGLRRSASPPSRRALTMPAMIAVYDELVHSYVITAADPGPTG
ncbi:hypothetical protein GGX14DRAFT_574425 [Mycena pura]|uniref:DUF6534 domain-containing protein n=1 Tax=Mycena pura TaxID=153505 RepID=A0AAD6Y504_9AGAR|nr:hypothetical protein GGX14DRAFT_574425 [Mycena pura]